MNDIRVSLCQNQTHQIAKILKRPKSWVLATIHGVTQCLALLVCP
jgi:hypothetical protein